MNYTIVAAICSFAFTPKDTKDNLMQICLSFHKRNCIFRVVVSNPMTLPIFSWTLKQDTATCHLNIENRKEQKIRPILQSWADYESNFYQQLNASLPKSFGNMKTIYSISSEKLETSFSRNLRTLRFQWYKHSTLGFDEVQVSLLRRKGK